MEMENGTDFGGIDYSCLDQNLGAFDDNWNQSMYDRAHDFTQKSYAKPENVGNQLEALETNQPNHYDTDSFFNSSHSFAEPQFSQFEEVQYPNMNNTCDSRVALAYAYNKAQDFSKQLPSSEENHVLGYLSTGDSSTSFSHNIAHAPCMDNWNANGSPFSMNSPMETTAASTPIVAVKEEKGADSQNAKRNMPVLIVQRVKQSFLDTISVGGKKARINGGRLDYIHSVLNLNQISGEKQAAFKGFLSSLDFGNKRTWNVIKEQFAGKNSDFVSVLLDGIDSFLSEAGAADFKSWVDENKKMKDSSKRVLFDCKGWFRESFQRQFEGVNMINFC